MTDSELSIPAPSWQTVSILPSLDGGNVHVWRADVVSLGPCADYFDALMDDDERARGSAFRAPADRLRHVVARGVLRAIAGHYLVSSPLSLGFKLGPFGKPRLAPPHHDTLRFNVSHSGDVVLFAFARDGDVGIDVEHWNPRLNDAERTRIGQSVFSTAERAAIELLSSPAERERAFYTLWSRKEAYLKGTGAGISGGLAHVDVAADAPARVIADQRDAQAANQWELRDIDVGAGYSAALAFSPPGRDVLHLAASPHLFDT